MLMACLAAGAVCVLYDDLYRSFGIPEHVIAEARAGFEECYKRNPPAPGSPDVHEPSRAVRPQRKPYAPTEEEWREFD